MTSKKSTFQQIGSLIYTYQIVESQIEAIMVLLANSDDEMISIMMSELDFSGKLKTVDVMFARFVDVRRGIPRDIKSDFHDTISKVIKRCERRNDIVHSKYMPWLNDEGKIGLLRQNSKLRSSKGIREESEEELLPEAFDDDLKNISTIRNELERYRLTIIDWLYRDESA
jgi:hypothetical protein